MRVVNETKVAAKQLTETPLNLCEAEGSYQYQC